MSKEQRIYTGKSVVSLTNRAGKAEQPHAKNETGPLLHFMLK